MNITRRKLLKQLTKSTLYLSFVGGWSNLALAKWNEKAFKAKVFEQAVKERYGDLPIADSSGVFLKAPTIAENGAVVPITVSSDIPNTKSISLFVKDNPTPLISTLNFGANSSSEVQIRIRMAKTSSVIAIAEADGKLYRTHQLVKVTIGGCGG